MIRNVLVIAAAASAVLFAGATASADESMHSRAGTKGHVAAWDSDRVTLLEVDACNPHGYSYDYTSCGAHLKTRIDERLCNERGKGTHRWYSQVGSISTLFLRVTRCD